MHTQMARELVGDARAFDARLEKLTRLIADTVADHGTKRPEVSHCEIPPPAPRPLGMLPPARILFLVVPSHGRTRQT